jgi:hypothetical protein
MKPDTRRNLDKWIEPVRDGQVGPEFDLYKDDTSSSPIELALYRLRADAAEAYLAFRGSSTGVSGNPRIACMPHVTAVASLAQLLVQALVEQAVEADEE